MATPTVNHSTEGVDFDFPGDGAIVKAHISREALQDHCGASDDSATWLSAFEGNQDRIVEIARARLAQGAQEPVVVATVDF